MQTSVSKRGITSDCNFKDATMSKFTFTSRGLHQWQPLKRWTKSTENDFKDVELIRVELDWDNIDRAKGKDFYLESYSTLCSVIDELASRTFKGRGNLSKDAWAYRYPDEFYNHARAVARPDPHAGHWEDLLRVQEERIFLVRAVIMKAIGETVLSEDLFVADHRHEKMLSDDGTASLTRNSKISPPNHIIESLTTNRITLQVLGGLTCVPP